MHLFQWLQIMIVGIQIMKMLMFKSIKNSFRNAAKAKNMIKNLIENFEKYIDPKDPTNNCLDVAIITAPEKRTQKTKDKLKKVAGLILKKKKNHPHESYKVLTKDYDYKKALIGGQIKKSIIKAMMLSIYIAELLI